jgi:hypothetical protein
MRDAMSKCRLQPDVGSVAATTERNYSADMSARSSRLSLSMSGSVVAAFQAATGAAHFCAVAFGSGGVRAVHGRPGI